MSAHGTLSRYEWTGRPLPSFLMSLLSTHFRRRSSCIAMLTSGCRRPVAFSISTDVVSSLFERNTRVFAMFLDNPVSISRSTNVSSLRLRRTSRLVGIPRHLLIYQYIFVAMQPTNARRGSEYRAFGDGPGPIVIGRRGR